MCTCRLLRLLLPCYCRLKCPVYGCVDHDKAEPWGHLKTRNTQHKTTSFSQHGAISGELQHSVLSVLSECFLCFQTDSKQPQYPADFFPTHAANTQQIPFDCGRYGCSPSVIARQCYRGCILHIICSHPSPCAGCGVPA